MTDAPDRMFGAFVGKRMSLRGGNIRKLAGSCTEAARPDLVYFTLTGIGFCFFTASGDFDGQNAAFEIGFDFLRIDAPGICSERRKEPQGRSET